jgi:hypothetical protein
MTKSSAPSERIVWTGRPTVVSTPPILRAAAALAFTTSVVSTLFAVVVAKALGLSPAPLLLFAAWAATLGLLLLHGPRIWLEKVQYTVTETRVVSQRGLFKRSIERRSISFARIFWNARHPGTGDIELVRAVQTGALRRKLSLRLVGVTAPDRVWAIVRGTEDITPVGSDKRPLAQRLDRGERVVWAARPRPRLRAYLPNGPREASQLLLGLLLSGSVVAMLARGAASANRLLAAGLSGLSAVFIAMVAAVTLTALYLALFAAYLIYDSVIRAGRLVHDTRYLVTDRRVLIQRGSEELHLDRAKIVDVIDTPAGAGLRNVFMVLDGPRARALAASGAFGEGGHSPYLRPVFHAVADAESVSKILREPDLRRAA